MTQKTTRVFRAFASVVTAAAIVAAAAPAVFAVTPVQPAASTDATIDGLGAPQRVLLESVHATGKVLQIGAEAAQASSAPGSTDRAAASIATMASADPRALAAQALQFYPVTGAKNTYVIADQSNRVLVRTDNAQGAFRYLQLADVADSAGNPYAQWETREAGNGAVSLVNVQEDSAKDRAALDLYNWKTADGSEVQTYTANPGAAVQQWRVHPIAPTVAVPAQTIALGTAPVLPSTLTARYSWGRTVASAVTWTMPDAETWTREGTVSVAGSATGFFGERIDLEASVVVGVFGDADDSVLTTYAGATVREVAMRAPSTVTRTVGGTGQTVTAPVTWDFSALSDADFAQSGTVTVPAASTLGFAATLTVTVAPAREVNLLRQSGVHADYLFKDATTFALTDGDRNTSGFADWRSGGASNRVNPNRVSFVFDEPRQITGVKVFDIGGKQNIGTVTVQYRTLRGGWANLPSPTQTWPYTNTSANLALEVSVTPVLATGVRAVITNKSSSTWMSLSEIEVYGPQLAPAS